MLNIGILPTHPFLRTTELVPFFVRKIAVAMFS